MQQLLMMIAPFATLISGVSADVFSAAEAPVMGAYLALYAGPNNTQHLNTGPIDRCTKGGNIDSMVVALNSPQTIC